MVGTALISALEAQGQDIVRLVRPTTHRKKQNEHGREVLWDPGATMLDARAEAADAIIHLAGANIGESRWTPARKNLLRDSRVAATHHLVDLLAKLRRPPRVFVAASAIGFYGDRGGELLTESSAPGNDFLAGLTRDWEAQSMRAIEFGARVVILRFGIILSKHGGALPRMALPFRFGVGGRIGTGQQWMSWIVLDDVVAVICHAAANDTLNGPVNAVSPQPVRNAEFTSALATVLHRPAVFPAPAFALRLALGEMADGLLLSSQRVQPEKLRRSGYQFLHPRLDEALESVWNAGN
jgi:uncharacterized protein (TIGR01777 family)